MGVLEQGSAHLFSPPLPHFSSCPRGMVVVADKTSELYQKTYWASYNIPYVPPPCICLTSSQLPMLAGDS